MPAEYPPPAQVPGGSRRRVRRRPSIEPSTRRRLADRRTRLPVLTPCRHDAHKQAKRGVARMTRPRPPDRIASSLSKSISGRVLHEPLYRSVGAAILCRFWSYSWRHDMDKSQLVRFARLGAVARLAEIEQERQAILREFPDLRRARPDASEAAAPAATTRGTRGARSAMSAAQRKAVSERMRKYWAARRGGSAPKPAGKSAGKSAAKSATKRAPRKMSAAARKRIAAAQKARWAEWRKKKGAAA